MASDGQPGRGQQEQHHKWRMDALGSAELGFGADPAAHPGAALWFPLSLWAVFSAAPLGAASALLASLVAACVATRAPPVSRKPATWSLQQLWTLSMTAPFCIEELLHALQGDVHVRLFEQYARGNFRVDGVCQLILRGPLKLQVRALLPKVLPAMVLTKNMQTIEEFCALLEESAQSLFTPQLPYILSAMARQPVESMAGAFKFISERVYSRQMSITSICDASLGQVLVLILWNSVSPEGHEESRRLCRYAVENIVGALKASAANAGSAVGAAGSTRPALGAAPLQPRGQRRTIDSVSGGAAAGATDGPPRKRRSSTCCDTAGGGAVGCGAAVVAATGSADVPEVMQTTVQTLEDSFLHVLDILEIVLSGNRQSPKWDEYSPLICDPHGEGRPLDHGRLLAAIALLFELVPQSLHRFAPKVLEFLHSASELSSFHPEGARCWQLFVQHVGVAKLRLLLPAVVAELLRLAAQLRPRAPDGCSQNNVVCLRPLLNNVVCQTCRVYPDLVASLPPLPPWPELTAARAALGGKQPDGRGETLEGFSRRLEAGLEQLESAAQQAVRRAALEHITSLVESQRPSSARITQLNTALLSRLMRALLKFLWESSAWPDDQLMCGRLLGSLGAIDPARLSQLDLGNAEQQSRTPADLGNADKLARRVLADFLVPNLTSKNSYAFAAQEILRYLQGCGRAPAVLAGLSQDVRETLRPYMHSSYQLVDGAQAFEDTSTFDGVVVLAVGLTTGEQRALFLACLPAAHGNHALSLFLMHHVLHSLLESRVPTEQLGVLAASLGGLLDSPKDATAQAVFSLVDDLIERREKLSLSAGHSRAQPADETARERMKQRIDALRSPITHRRIVSASVRCGAHARALHFLEQAIVDGHKGDGTAFDVARIESEEDCLLLQSIYRDLDEPDGALGALRAGPATAKTRALRFEQESRWQDVQSLCEVQLASAAQEGEARRELLCRLAHCPHNMRRFESSLRLIEGMNGEDMHARLRPLAVEAAWQLSSWGRLEGALGKPAAQGADDFQVSLGQALLKFHQRDSAGLEGALRDTTLQVTQTVASAARESYTRAYQHLLKLHVLSDLSWLAGRRADAGAAPPAPGELARCLLQRAEVVVPTFSAKQLVLSPLRAALEDMGLADDCKRVELAVVQLCRKHGAPVAMEHPEVSFSGAGVSAETLTHAQLEWGRLLYARGSRHDALRHMQQLAPRSPKARLLGARWATEPAAELLIPRVAEAEFKIAKDSLPADEAACFYHAAYLDRLLKEHLARRSSASASSPPLAERSPFDMKNLITFTLRGYLQALRRGTKRLHFILNRVLQLAWDCCELDMHKVAALEEISSADRSLEPWMWYPVLPQLISRLQNPDMRELFRQLIAKVLMAHPHQAGWQIMQLEKSSCKEMVSLSRDMLMTLGRKDNNFHRAMCKYSKLFDQLIRLAQFQPEDPRQQHISLEKHNFAKLVGGFSQRTQSQGGSEGWRVIVPLQSQMTVAIPRMRLHGEPGATIDPFPETIFAESCHNVAEVLRSKEKPKKITFLGDDGRSYPFLCKSEKRGDLRKDSRMMEFGLMVNQLLQKSPDARRRNLGIRTFNVVILTESCGLIEWVPNTKGMRPIIEELWNSSMPGAMLTVRQIKDMYSTTRSQYETFTKEVLRRNPPILHKWFSLNADPSVWLSKRLLFSRTQALWCMLGYLVGLGDRHGENILVEQNTGRIVHVDFDCLFGKGMHLECPETVPFRLTQNCVAAMGVTGVEGVFRSCCELVMGVLRDSANRQTILSVLHVFIADPLIEWARRPQVPLRSQDEKQSRIRDARITIGDVEKKLDGMLNVGAAVDLRAAHQGESVLTPEERGRNSSGLLGRDRGVGLSVAGQVDELLKAAMCKRNLSEMYVGWQSWQ